MAGSSDRTHFLIFASVPGLLTIMAVRRWYVLSSTSSSARGKRSEAAWVALVELQIVRIPKPATDGVTQTRAFDRGHVGNRRCSADAIGAAPVFSYTSATIEFTHEEALGL